MRRRLLISLAILAGAGLLSWWSSELIAAYFPDRPLAPDLLLRALPFGPASAVARTFQYIADAAVTFAMVAAAVHLLRNRPEQLPKGITILGVQYTLRAFLNLLTPLATPHQQPLFGWFPIQNGMFPSGHTANVLLCFLLVDGSVSPKLKAAMFGAFVLEVAGLLVSRGHYSIDIVGGVLLAYFVWTEWNRGRGFDWLKRLVEA